ncbi:HD domain-containing protein [Vibrio sp. SM6]|uniref:HD domain-containing protein n=1 Tax=Vibrio agarilyticus TaxID=2726741 RepID=A0A7X8TTK7_9VIBR|nr:HD domain-containing protein [Vibrio agarilyticus]NLS14550.1 HD domain-containing protein [Vibrio agarilyticus]
MNDSTSAELLQHFEPRFLALAEALYKSNDPRSAASSNDIPTAADNAHDITHIRRVVETARELAHLEGADLAVVIPAAFLHDCVTLPKNHPDRAKSSILAAQKSQVLLEEMGYPSRYHSAIAHAIEAHSFSAQIPPQTLEAKVVQDADRLDALGAIGIARCINVSSHFNAALYHSTDPFAATRDLDDKAYMLDHFSVKLFPIASTMTTASGKAAAQQRVQFMHAFLQQLQQEIGKLN